MKPAALSPVVSSLSCFINGSDCRWPQCKLLGAESAKYLIISTESAVSPPGGHGPALLSTSMSKQLVN